MTGVKAVAVGRIMLAFPRMGQERLMTVFVFRLSGSSRALRQRTARAPLCAKRTFTKMAVMLVCAGQSVLFGDPWVFSERDRSPLSG